MFKELGKIFENVPRLKLLKFFVFQPEQRTTAAAAGALIGIPKAVAERETRALARAGLLTIRKQKKNIFFSANQSHPWLPALQAFLDVTTLPDDRAILGAFRGVRGITLLIAAGALAREERGSVDLLIVARKSQNSAIAKSVYKIECMTGLPLRYAVMEPDAYTDRLESNDRLLRDVFEFSYRRIVGKP